MIYRLTQLYYRLLWWWLVRIDQPVRKAGGWRVWWTDGLIFLAALAVMVVVLTMIAVVGD